jgi:hypothetical protein
VSSRVNTARNVSSLNAVPLMVDGGKRR